MKTLSTIFAAALILSACTKKTEEVPASPSPEATAPAAPEAPSAGNQSSSEAPK